MELEMGLEEVLNRTVKSVLALASRTVILQLIQAISYSILIAYLNVSEIGIFIISANPPVHGQRQGNQAVAKQLVCYPANRKHAGNAVYVARGQEETPMPQCAFDHRSPS